MKRVTVLLTLLSFTVVICAQNLSDFEDLGVPQDSFLNGADQSGGFQSGQHFFPNNYSTDFGGYWKAGWALSSKKDSITSGSANQYSAKPSSGALGSSTYAVGQQGAIIHFNDPDFWQQPLTFWVTNSTYAYNSMRDGDMFAKQFGGPTGEDPDFFLLQIFKYKNGVLGPEHLEVYLADYRSNNPEDDYILDEWMEVDLSHLGPADSLLFSLSSSDVGSYGMNTPAYFCLDMITSDPNNFPFAPSAGQMGSTAIPSNSLDFINWAKGCVIERGPQDISDPNSPDVNFGQAEDATGPAVGGVAVSLGDGGQATLWFDPPIRNGEGWDFAVFENSFSDSFLELAYVEVSSDGEQFYRFPATSLTQTEDQIGAFDTLDARQLQNFAGKYRGGYGVPFNLEELVSIQELDMESIRYVRIVDVVGSIDPTYGSTDYFGEYVNDPFPTAFESSGFDLDAVGVFHEGVPSSVSEKSLQQPIAYPNPVISGERVQISGISSGYFELYSSYGTLVDSGQFFNETMSTTPSIPAGVYFLSIYSDQLERIGQQTLLFCER